MNNPVLFLPAALHAFQALEAAMENRGVPSPTFGVAERRASQINGCSVCVDIHCRELRKAGETDKRIFALAAWRHTPYFTGAERAALRLPQDVTRLSDRKDPVPDEIWDEAARHYDERALAPALVAIAKINVLERYQRRGGAGRW